MTRYMLDTNTVSHIIKEHPLVLSHLLKVQKSSVCISVITEAELRFGMAKRPEAKRLHERVKNFLTHVESLSWESNITECYTEFRASMEKRRKILSDLDMLIAAHALSIKATLVTSDKAFKLVHGLKLEDWKA